MKQFSGYLIGLLGWGLLAALLYWLFEYFFFHYELSGSSFMKTLLIAFAAAGGIAFISLFPLLGLPGAIVLSISSLLGFSEENISGDKAWPAAIITSLVWPFSIPAGVLAKQFLLTSAYQEYANTALCLTTAAGTILTVVVMNLSTKN